MILVNGFLQLRSDDVPRLRPALARQVAATTACDGCVQYAFGTDLDNPTRLRIAERWRDRTAQAAHLVGDHMVAFNIAMRAVRVLEGVLDSYEDGMVRKILEVPARRFRGERQEPDLVLIMGSVRFVAGEIDRLMPEFDAMLHGTRADRGCEAYACARDLLEPDLVHISGRWSDEGAFSAHLQTPHAAAFNTMLATALIEDSDVRAYRPDGNRVLVRR